MDFAHTPEDEAFRDELRAWLDVNLPKFLADWGGDDDQAGGRNAGIARTQDRRKDWQRRLNEGRWAAINWPKSWDGREATPVQNVIYSEEMARVRAPGIYNANGIWQIGPMIIAWGTEEQQQRWLPGILSAEEHWCQGFSEPQAGSDLANLRTTAIRDGDEYIVNGQKIWISTAHLAKWGLFLFRTDPSAIERGAKHEGITAFIVDMKTPASSAARSATSSATRCSTRCGSPTCGSRLTAASARKTRAGRLRWERSDASASARPASRSPWPPICAP